MQFSANYSLYGCGTWTCPHQFRVDLENKILCDKQERQLLLFRIQEISGGENSLRNQSRPWRFRGIQVNIYHVVIYSS